MRGKIIGTSRPIFLKIPSFAPLEGTFQNSQARIQNASDMTDCIYYQAVLISLIYN